jgi:hypothetical protein
MEIKTESAAQSLVRSAEMRALLGLLFCYSVHVLGEWKPDNNRPNPETTSTMLIHNKFVIFRKAHTLTTNADIPVWEKVLTEQSLVKPL